MRTCKECACNHICNITHTDNGPACIDYKAEAITELKNLKDKIEKLNCVDYGSMFSYESHNGARDMQSDIVSIIEKHMAELEAENK